MRITFTVCLGLILVMEKKRMIEMFNNYALDVTQKCKFLFKRQLEFLNKSNTTII